MKEYSDQKIFEKIVKYAGPENKNTLEIGCGTGRISSLLSKSVGRLTAIDPDESALDKAKTRIPGVDFKVGSGEKLHFLNQCFDLIIFTLSLHHQNSARALDQAAQVLNPDGQILVIEPVSQGDIEQVFAYLYNEDADIIRAQKSIIESGLSISASEIFNAEWVFDDKDDLFQSLFAYYNMPFDADIVRDISRFLGPKAQLSPIVLMDEMMIQVLGK